MNLALYREFRPKNFDEVVGQDYLIKTLKNQIKTDRLTHAYLFCGPRGTGKTSTAKIFAKAVNCTHNTDGNPCGLCAECVALTEANTDIVEIDAASNNRVEEIRDLIEKVSFPPMIGKYKVYIIDEVHMLTDSAFNALLKTLEEPPKNVVFLISASNQNKVLKTILSRSQKVSVGRFNNEVLGNILNIDQNIKNIAISQGNGNLGKILQISEDNQFLINYENMKKLINNIFAIDTMVFLFFLYFSCNFN